MRKGSFRNAKFFDKLTSTKNRERTFLLLFRSDILWRVVEKIAMQNKWSKIHEKVSERSGLLKHDVLPRVTSYPGDLLRIVYCKEIILTKCNSFKCCGKFRAYQFFLKMNFLYFYS